MNRTLFFLIVLFMSTAVISAAQDSSSTPLTPQAEVQLGNLYIEQKDYSTAMTWFRKAAEQGNTAAQNNIGWLYQNGFGVQQDYAEAKKWYREAAEQGDAHAEVNIGCLYQGGLGVKQDYAAAMSWYRKAADQHNADAQNHIGMLYEKGLGVEQNYMSAMAWFYMAADQGNALAQDNIGWLYEKGLGVAQDNAKAMTWYRKAAGQDDAEAKANIARLSQGEGQSEQKPGTTQNDAAPNSASAQLEKPRLMLPGGIRPPHAIYDPEPEYSDEGRKKGIAGTVLLSVVIGANGQPRDIKVVLPLGNGLDEKAVDAIKTWKFDPATKEDGTPVAVQVMVQVDFHLDQPSNIGEVEIAGSPASANLDSYLSPLILEAKKCWNAATEDKAHALSIEQGQVMAQFAITKDGQISATEITSSSGDAVLDQDAKNCISSLKIDKPLSLELSGKDITVHMQLLYNAEVSLNPGFAKIAAGDKEQFRIDMIGKLSNAANWSVFGAGCKDAACGTISSDGLYTAPDVLPDPAYVRVKGTLPGANPISGSAIVMLVKQR